MLRHVRKLRWPALVATLLLAAAWLLSHRGGLWIAPKVGNRIPVLLLMSGVAQIRLDPLPSTPALLPPSAGFSSTSPMDVFVYH